MVSHAAGKKTYRAQLKGGRMLLWSAVFGQFAGAEADRDVQVRRLPGHGKVEDISKAFGIGCYGIAWGGIQKWS